MGVFLVVRDSTALFLGFVIVCKHVLAHVHYGEIKSLKGHMKCNLFGTVFEGFCRDFVSIM